MTHSSIDWLWNNLTDDLIGSLSQEKRGMIYHLFKQAKAMHYEEIMKAYDVGCESEYTIRVPQTSTRYYDVTFKTNEQQG